MCLTELPHCLVRRSWVDRRTTEYPRPSHSTQSTKKPPTLGREAAKYIARTKARILPNRNARVCLSGLPDREECPRELPCCLVRRSWVDRRTTEYPCPLHSTQSTKKPPTLGREAAKYIARTKARILPNLSARMCLSGLPDCLVRRSWVDRRTTEYPRPLHSTQSTKKPPTLGREAAKYIARTKARILPNLSARVCLSGHPDRECACRGFPT